MADAVRVETVLRSTEETASGKVKLTRMLISFPGSSAAI